MKKISSSAPETRNDKNSLTKVKVGRVPDRGGRPAEMATPPPEMPSWQQRSGQSHASTTYKHQRGGGGGKDFLDPVMFCFRLGLLVKYFMALFRVRVNNNKQNWTDKLKLADFARLM